MPMPEFRLHCFYESGNAFKAAMMLDVTGAAWEPRIVRFLEGETRQAQWRADYNEMGEAPVLEHGALRLSQSGVILDYLAERTGQFAAETEEEGREIWRWILFDNHKFTSYFSMLRFLCGIQKTGETPVTEYLRMRVRTAWGVVERHLSARDFMVGARPTIADLSMAGYQFYNEETGIDRAAEFPAITAWTERIASLPGWRPPAEAMPRTAP